MHAGHSAAQGTSERLKTVLEAGDPAYSGGATDASVRLTNLLKVCCSLTPASPRVPFKHAISQTRGQPATLRITAQPGHKAESVMLTSNEHRFNLVTIAVDGRKEKCTFRWTSSVRSQSLWVHLSPPQAVAQAPAANLSTESKDWVPLFLALATANTTGVPEEASVESADHQTPVASGKGGAVSAVSAIGGK